MKNAIALFPANGIGDVVLMNILACYAHHMFNPVCVYHPDYESLQPLFPHLHLFPRPPLEALPSILQGAKKVFVQNDHSAFAYRLHLLRQSYPGITFIHPKASPLTLSSDIVFSTKHAFATNLIEKAAPFFPGQSFSYDWLREGFNPKIFRSEKKRVAIHPTSRDPARNWPMEKYVALKNRLQAQGFSPYFIVSEQEHEAWRPLGLSPHELPLFSSLNEVAKALHRSGYFIGNDSGLGHIASMVGLPTLTLSNYKKRALMWRPDFATNLIITPLVRLPNWKGIGWRLREKGWHYFVSLPRVEKAFNKLVRRCP